MKTKDPMMPLQKMILEFMASKKGEAVVASQIAKHLGIKGGSLGPMLHGLLVRGYIKKGDHLTEWIPTMGVLRRYMQPALPMTPLMENNFPTKKLPSPLPVPAPNLKDEVTLKLAFEPGKAPPNEKLLFELKDCIFGLVDAKEVGRGKVDPNEGAEIWRYKR